MLTMSAQEQYIQEIYSYSAGLFSVVLSCRPLLSEIIHGAKIDKEDTSAICCYIDSKQKDQLFVQAC